MSTQPGNIDRITGLTFDTHYACLLTEGRRYARTFDATPRTLVRRGPFREGPTGATVTLVWDTTPAGKYERVPAGKRYFIR
jgi:hypothetical protein